MPALAEGPLYRLKALTLSYYQDGTNRLNSGYSVPCYFKVDPTAPKAPQVTFGTPYTECLSNDCVAHGGPGVSGTFTFKPAAVDTNVVAYQYKISTGAVGSSTWSADRPVSSPTFTVTPAQAGKYTLYVRAKDNVGTGRYGAETPVEFMVDEGQDPVGRWHFDEAGGAAVDSGTWDGRDDATLNGGAARDDRGRRGLLTHDDTGTALATPVTDKGLNLNGTSAYAASAGTVLDTSASYTVSAWIRVDAAATRTMTVLTQTPESGSPFSQKYIPFGLSYAGGGDNKWSMNVLATDGAIRKASAQQATARDVWTHVVGVHDATTKKISLYLNGQFQSSADAGTAWKATGPLQIGRGIWADAYTDYLQGSVDEVSVWQRDLSAIEVAEEAKLAQFDRYNNVELVADWSADRGSGTSVPDTTSGYGKSLALTGGASLDGESMVLDGVDDASVVAGPVVDDTGSFTVTTLVSVDGDKLAGKATGYTGQIAGQRAADGSAWGLWYKLTGQDIVPDDDGMEHTVPVGKWHFGRLDAGGTFSSVVSQDSALVDGMVRLTGVFDAQDRGGTISLYVGGIPNGDAEVFTAKAGSGDFAIGKGFTSGAWQHYLPGSVAEVRVWAGAMGGFAQVGDLVGD